MFDKFIPRQVVNPLQHRNFKLVLQDGLAVGYASAAIPFLAVFLTRLGASNFEVGLLTSMPALTGLLLAIPLGGWLQQKRNLVPWYSWTRLLQLSGIALTGLIPFILPQNAWIQAILLVWGIITLPQTILTILFNVVLSAVAGEVGRFELLSRRWALIGIITTITTLGIGALLTRGNFPINFQLVFLLCSIGAIFSFFYTGRLVIPVNNPAHSQRIKYLDRFRQIFASVRKYPSFLSFTFKRFVFLTGVAFAAPLFPLYYVRQADLPDISIAYITTAQTLVMVAGYFIWLRFSRTRGSRPILLWTTLGLSLFPILVALTTKSAVIILLAGIAGFFNAGLDLVFFDELMRNIPVDQSPSFVAFAQTSQYLTTMISPLVSAWLAQMFGLSVALIIAGCIQLAGFFLFTRKNGGSTKSIPASAS
jgi:hypothetical protein